MPPNTETARAKFERDKQILISAIRGLSRKQIAEDWGVTVYTVDEAIMSMMHRAAFAARVHETPSLRTIQNSSRQTKDLWIGRVRQLKWRPE